MKRLFALMLTALLAFTLAACGTGNSDTDGSQDGQNEEDLPQTAALELDTPYEVPDYAKFTLASISTTDRVQATMGGAYYESDDGTPYIDVVLDLTNTSTSEISSEDFLALTAVTPSGIEYQGSLYCVETDNMTRVSAWESISPMSSVRFHAAVAVPAAEKEVALQMDVNGTLFTCGYQTGTEIKNTVALNPGDLIENEDYAALEFTGYEFTDDLLPSDTSRSYRHYQVDNPDSTYLVMKYVVTNYQATEKDIDTFLNVKATFGEKYQYTGFVIREDDDARGFSTSSAVTPLTAAKLFYLIEVPKAVVEKDFTVSTVFDKQEYVFSVQPQPEQP